MENVHTLAAFNMGIDTHQEPVVYMREDCHVCVAEGFNASSRVLVTNGSHMLIATLNVVERHVLEAGRVGLSKIAVQRLRASDGDEICIGHAPVLHSLSHVRKKVFGHALSAFEMREVIEDISAHRYSDMEIASFLSVCAGGRLDLDEIISLTQAMVACGKRLTWPGEARIFDKHCIGGLPGNRTTPLVVSIASAAGLTVPKTSSRAITSPAGTADTMEVLTTVDLPLDRIQAIVAETGACLAWGGAVNLSPADDLLIRIERALDLDGEGQLIASVLSKKIAAGSTHVIIDIPVGETAKVRTRQQADRLASLFTEVGQACDIFVRCVMTDGSKPIGRGIGPAEEAKDLLAVLKNEPGAPRDLRQRALHLTANLLDLADNTGLDAAMRKAVEILDSGQAWQQFQRILRAQGGIKALPQAAYQHRQLAVRSGVLMSIDNRRLSRLAKLAGAPLDKAAGLRLFVEVGDRISPDQPLFTLCSESTGERDYALEYYRQNQDIFVIQESV
ncbi:thymidine phosphorylase family protein [Bowmanella dokdonensis]|uniref:Putative thymidine phosphorylase n=1 Tax=Bowmanella dokdonensis TaxID=751969 RepID=A0A939DNB7_9ALTE|nr:thymidine phosphorylase family protein [Bowmanella dokdonensis]MBN7825802.1 thymidine phosphorylase family protein [Bowmanella dokdonensis]